MSTPTQKAELAVPANLQPYVEVLGADLAVTMFLQLGGAVQYFGLRPHAKSLLVRTVGLENAKALGKILGPGMNRVPLANEFCAQYLRYERNMTVKAIARLMHTSDVTVRKYAPQNAERHPDLFDTASD